MRFGSMPLIVRKSSTLLKAPYDSRIFRILSAVEEPIPGTCCSCNAIAAFRFTGRSGGFASTHKPIAEDDRVNLWGSDNRHTYPAIIERSQALEVLLRLTDAIPSGVINSQFAKERSLRFDVLAVADHDDLHVCRVEIRSGGGHNISGL
jgi:hypothetical protein